MKKQTKSNQVKTLFLKMQSGSSKKVIIPAGCKMTFGPLCPGSKNAQHNSEGATALRIYNGTSQIAVFVKVESYYETESVQCITKETKRASKIQGYEENGIVKNRNVSVEVSEWKDELSEEAAPEAEDTFKALAVKGSNDVF